MKKPDHSNINASPKADSTKEIPAQNPIENNGQNPNFAINIPKNVPIKKIDPPKMSARGEPQKNPISTVTPSDFTDLLDLEDPVELKNQTYPNVPQKLEIENLENVQKSEKKNDENKQEEENKTNAFSFDFKFLSKNEPGPKKEIDQIDMLFG